MASHQTLNDKVNALIGTPTPAEPEGANKAPKRVASPADADNNTPAKTNKAPALLLRATKVEPLTPREMEVLAVAWDSMRDGRTLLTVGILQINYKKMSEGAGYTEESARVAMGKIKRKLANAAASEREKRELEVKGQSEKGSFGKTADKEK
ncbi:hypothetical protein NA57DRAFT_71735 [Rhizodiscina lignyota]|uniref:Uncharacterized protein n=1 Tax=Rhizodiscina lignyota TaxID=1504668 RepID=A0A9P4IP06_9PEZI|nr:hypothetical protein NA57DRAFT_71735 [Rhizodiscina lignyota]